MITIVDYGIGNLRSIEKAFLHIGARVLRTGRPDDVAQAECLVLPGVGAFRACINEVRGRGLESPILDAVSRGIPFLGVCIGMQMLFDESEERGPTHGLGILPGRVVRFQNTPNGSQSMKVPHMGWNTLTVRRASPLLAGLDSGSYCYFVHSYYAEPEREEDVLAATTYGIDFPAIVARGNIYGVQFHPEKSHRTGLRLLKNFAGL